MGNDPYISQQEAEFENRVYISPQNRSIENQPYIDSINFQDNSMEVLTSNSEILDWSLVSGRTGETRVQHVGTHLAENTSKELHGVFVDNPVSVLNQAWSNRASGTLTVSGNVDIWRIPYSEAGLQGGSDGYGRILNVVEIIVQRGTNRIITGYPAD